MSRKKKKAKTEQERLHELWAIVKNQKRNLPYPQGTSLLRCEISILKLARTFLDNAEMNKGKRNSIIHIATCHVKEAGDVSLLLTSDKELIRLLGQVYVKAQEEKKNG